MVPLDDPTCNYFRENSSPRASLGATPVPRHPWAVYTHTSADPSSAGSDTVHTTVTGKPPLKGSMD